MTWRLAAGVLLAAGLLALFSGPGPPFVPFTGKLSLESPFLKERYSAPFTDDFGAMERIGGAISASGYDDEAIRLREAWQRLMLKRFLREPHVRPATAGDAIRSEPRAPETIKELRERVLRQVSVRLLPDDNDTLSVWTLKRVEVSNGLPVALTRVAVSTAPAADGTRSVALSCRPATPTSVEAAELAAIRAQLREAEAKPPSRVIIPPPELHELAAVHMKLFQAVARQDGVPLPAGETAAFICPEMPSGNASGLPKDTGALLLLSYVQASPYFVSVGGAGMMGGSHNAYHGVADFELSGCAARLTCDETRVRQIMELEARLPQIAFVLAMFALAGATWLATRPLRGRAPPAISRGATFASGFALVTSVFQLLVAYFLLNPRSGYVMLALLLPLLVLVALQAVATASLAVMLAWKRAQVTRVRAFNMGLAVFALAAPWLLLLR